LGNLKYEPLPISLTTWVDYDGYTWLRVDDFGMGMDEEIISNYFLKVGKSYYQSEQFNLEQIEWKVKSNIDFLPISRFGIGILSCFIIGDIIELSTRKITDSPSRNALRMRMDGLNSFFVLKKEADKHTCETMPSQNKKIESYRGHNEFGTSIAVRFNAKTYRADFDLRKILNDYIIVSPIPIKFNDEFMGGNPKDIIEKEWCDECEYPIDSKDQKEMETLFGMKFFEPLKIKISPLNLTAVSPSANFKGQGIIIQLKISEKDIANFIQNKYFSISFDLKNDDDWFRLHANYRNVSEIKKLEQQYGIDNISYFINVFKYRSTVRTLSSIDHNEPKLSDEVIKYRKIVSEYNSLQKHISLRLENINRIINDLFPQRKLHNLSHNGIRIPFKIKDLRVLGIHNPIKEGELYYNFALNDSLRPELSLSRDELRNLSWNIHSIANFSFLKALALLDTKPFTGMWAFGELLNKSELIMLNLLKDPLIRSDQYWALEPIFSIDNVNYSLVQLREINNGFMFTNPFNVEKYFGIVDETIFLSYCKAALVQIGLTVTYNTKLKKIKIIDQQIPAIDESLKYYTPLFFIEYEDSNLLRISNDPINSNHPFSKWLIENTELLYAKYPVLLGEMIVTISKSFDPSNRKFYHNICNEINIVLKKLRELNFEKKPSAQIYLTEEDFY
jgi:hypothetical protein